MKTHVHTKTHEWMFTAALFINNSTKLEIIQISINKWNCPQTVVNQYPTASAVKSCEPVRHKNLNDPKKHAQRKKGQMQVYILHNSIYKNC